MDDGKLENIEYYLLVAEKLLTDKKEKEFIDKIRQTFKCIGINGVYEDIEMCPDVFGISGRAARDVVDRAITETSNMIDTLVALHKLIDKNI